MVNSNALKVLQTIINFVQRNDYRDSINAYSVQQIHGQWMLCATDTHRVAMVELEGNHIQATYEPCLPLEVTKDVAYPSIQRVTPDMDNLFRKATFDATKLRELLSETAPMIGKKKKGCHRRVNMIFDASSGKCFFTVKPTLDETFSATLDCDMRNCADFAIAACVDFIIDALPTKGTITMHFNEASRPFMITYSDDSPFRDMQYLLMPMALDAGLANYKEAASA